MLATDTIESGVAAASYAQSDTIPMAAAAAPRAALSGSSGGGRRRRWSDAPSVAASSAPAPSGNVLWYRQPAETWTEALPIGNGRLGGMAYGDLAGMIQVNVDSLGAGSPIDRHREPPKGALEEARRLWFEGDVTGAQAIMQREFMSERLIGKMVAAVSTVSTVRKRFTSLFGLHVSITVIKYDKIWGTRSNPSLTARIRRYGYTLGGR